MKAPGIFVWSKLENLHLTLFFLGDIEPSAIAMVQSGLNEVWVKPFELGWGGLVIMPSLNVPKIIASGVIGDNRALSQLQRKIHDVCYPYAEKKDERAYFPHITLGRLKRGVPPSAKIVKRSLAQFELSHGSLEIIDSFELMSSELSPDGAVHRVIQEFPLDPAS